VVVPAGGAFRGLVCMRRAGRIEGSVEGEVIGGGLVQVGAGGHVRGRIDAGEVVVAGVVEGRVRSRGRVELLEGARVIADLEARRLVLAEGSFFDGDCATVGRTVASPKEGRPRGGRRGSPTGGNGGSSS